MGLLAVVSRMTIPSSRNGARFDLTALPKSFAGSADEASINKPIPREQ